MKGLYSGRQVIDLKSRSQKITRTQTAKQAYDAIVKKYGQINPRGHYFHAGKGVWHEWSMVRDKKRTGKIAPSKLEWSQRPNRYDWPGIDTKDVSKKHIFSVSQLKQKHPVHRTEKVVPDKQSLVNLPIRKPLDIRRDAKKLKNELTSRFKGIKISVKTRVTKHGDNYGEGGAIDVKYTAPHEIPEIEKIANGYRRELRTNNYGKAFNLPLRINIFVDFILSKPRYSVTSLKSPAKLSGRKSKSQIKMSKSPVVKSIPKPKAKLSLSQIKMKAPKGRAIKIKPDKGISYVFNGYPDSPQKATIANGAIKLTCYYEGKHIYTTRIKLTDWKDATNHQDTAYFEESLIRKCTPKEHTVDKSFVYAQRMAIEKVWQEYISSVTTKKLNIKRETGTFEYYGKKLTEGKYKDDFANIKNNIIDVLKTKYPGKLFMVVARGFYNREADVYWSGKPSEADVRKTGLGISKGWLNEGISRDIYWHNVPDTEMRARVNKVEHNKALKTKVKAGYTRKVTEADWEKPKVTVKMPSKIPSKAPSAVPNKIIKGRKVKTPIQLKKSVIVKSGLAKPKIYKGFLVTGDTYPVKNLIKSMGGKWNADYNGWVVPPKSAKALNKLTKEKKLKVRALKTEENVFRNLTAAERLDLRKAKYERKVDRWENKADKKSKEADQFYQRSHDLVKDIPFGQPILVGHHSEKADRNRRDKSWNLLGKSVHASAEADEAARKAGILSHVTDRLGSVDDIKGRISKLAKDRNHAKNKVTEAERNLEFARKRGDKQDIETQKANIQYWQKLVAYYDDSIKSFEDRLPAEAKVKPTYGINMSMLSGIKLKPAVGATSVAKRYHNKNLKGGNFAIQVRKGDAAIELNGNHNIDGIIYDLRIGPLFGVGVPVITEGNYQSVTMSKLSELIRKALEASKK